MRALIVSFIQYRAQELPALSYGYQGAACFCIKFQGDENFSSDAPAQLAVLSASSNFNGKMQHVSLGA